MSLCRAAILTGKTAAGIATIQLRGENGPSILQKIFRFQNQTQHDLHFGEIFDDDEMIDQVVVAIDPNDRSLEIHCHGGPRVVQRLLLLLEKHHVTITSWQTLDPPTNIAEEIQTALPLAKTRLGVLTLAAQSPGGLTSWTEQALGELKEDSSFLPETHKQIQKLLPGYSLAKKLLSGPSVVLTGPANVGKSTLANRLSGQQQSLVADLAGTTRDWTAQWIDIEGIPVELIDTAGRRLSKDPLEQKAIVLANQKLTQAELVILIIQADGREKAQIQQQLDLLKPQTKPLIVINKMDQITPEQQHIEHLYLSAATGENIAKLRHLIASRLGFDNFQPQQPLIFTQRQRDHLHQASKSMTAEKTCEELKMLLDNRH
jgi:tRNA modification GTPase